MARPACAMHERHGGHHEPCVHCQLAETRAQRDEAERRLKTAEDYITRSGLRASYADFLIERMDAQHG